MKRIGFITAMYLDRGPKIISTLDDIKVTKTQFVSIKKDLKICFEGLFYDYTQHLMSRV
jgi:hypothetical protein